MKIGATCSLYRLTLPNYNNFVELALNQQLGTKRKDNEGVSPNNGHLFKIKFDTVFALTQQSIAVVVSGFCFVFILVFLGLMFVGGRG